MATTEDIVRRYFAIVANLDSSVDEFRSIVAVDATFTELPNPISPTGHVRTLEETVAGFAAGKGRLEAQSIDIHEVVVAGDRAAVRSTWRGTIGGTEIVAHMGGFLTVRDGRIAAHETYDCYEPFSL